MMKATAMSNNNINNQRQQQRPPPPPPPRTPSRQVINSFDPYAVKHKNVVDDFDSDEESDVFQDISGATQESVPLVVENGGSNARRRNTDTNSTGGILGGGNGRRGTPPQQQKDEYSYSPIMDPLGGATTPAPPQPIHRHPLQSLTIGGYGPIPNNPSDDDSPNHDDSQQKSRPKSLVSNTIRCVHSCTKKYGCSSHRMIMDEGVDKNYYRDDFNDEPKGCSLGTNEEDGIWMNMSDQAGTIMCLMVWFLLGYSCLTIVWLAETGGLPVSLSMIYCILCSLALSCHAKTTLTDPGSVPQSAVPSEAQRKNHPEQKLSMCSQCQTFKPPFSHHCRICNRCVSRMDHHCPWMNNCIGAGNLKHFILFLIYTWLTCGYAMLLLGWNYFFCATENCTFGTVVIQLARVMTFLSVGAFLFISSMLMNVFYGLMTGIGTIDRLKKKALDTMLESDEEPIPLKDVFGIAGYHTWLLPIDPVFEDYDRVMGYSTPQRLLREQMMMNSNNVTANASAPIPVGGDVVDQHMPNDVTKDLLSP